MQATCSIQTTLFILCGHSKYRSDLSRYLKRFTMEGPRGADFYHLLCYRRRCRYNTDVSVKGIMRPLCRSPTLCRYWETVTAFKWQNRNRVRWVILGLSEDGACTDLFENLSVNSLKRDLSNNTTVNPPLCSLVNTLNKDFFLLNANGL